tara:strand:+ start:236 stop:481 length:246 start_codon:yes stop_codon:yes gene_type:complete
MKIGDLVALSAKGKSQDQNWRPNYFSAFGIIVDTNTASGSLLFTVQWFPRKDRNTSFDKAHLKLKHWRYELKHHKKPKTRS